MEEEGRTDGGQVEEEEEAEGREWGGGGGPHTAAIYAMRSKEKSSEWAGRRPRTENICTETG